MRRNANGGTLVFTANRLGFSTKATNERNAQGAVDKGQFDRWSLKDDKLLEFEAIELTQPT